MIYKATQKDYNAIRTFNNKLLKQHNTFDSHTWKSEYDMSLATYTSMCKQGLLYVMFQDEYIGFAYCTIRLVKDGEQYKRRNFCIDKFYIDVAFRGNNYSQLLLNFLQDIANDNKCDCLKVSAYVVNDAANESYKKFGFQPQYTEYFKVLK